MDYLRDFLDVKALKGCSNATIENYYLINKKGKKFNSSPYNYFTTIYVSEMAL